VLDDLGTASAVSWFCREFAQSYPTLQLRAAVTVVDSDVPERLSTAVFRSLQELLHNVAKHAHAREVVVSLARSTDQLWLEVTDDGVGLPESVAGTSMRLGNGMRNLQERAAMTGGRLRLQPAAGGVGTQARIEWKLAPHEIPKPDAA
jgi:signal transduction histidine kinase